MWQGAAWGSMHRSLPYIVWEAPIQGLAKLSEELEADVRKQLSDDRAQIVPWLPALGNATFVFRC